MLARSRLPCEKTTPENANLRQVGGRPVVAPTLLRKKGFFPFIFEFLKYPIIQNSIAHF